VILFSGLSHVRGADDQAVENFLKLERLYEKWNSGLFGSRKFYERELRKYLGHLIYKNIETPGESADLDEVQTLA
jgi:hypothetical protein